MDIRPIRNDDDHSAALKKIERYWNAAVGSAEADALDVLVTLVDAYENEHWPIEAADPVETLQAHMAASGRTQADLAKVIGSRPRASEVMARKRPLTINMIRGLVSNWHLPAELLISSYKLRKPRSAAQSEKPAVRKHVRKARRHRSETRKRAGTYA
jgi:HTH-type transcriptional regulator/antitoxin HigA